MNNKLIDCYFASTLIDEGYIGNPIQEATDDLLIEVKKLPDWKTGVGQLAIYAPTYPNHKKKLYLFDRHLPSRTRRIIDACRSQSIEVVFLQDLGFDPNCDKPFVIVEVES